MMSMNGDKELSLRIILENPPVGVVFGLQKGGGKNYETIQKQSSNGENLNFFCTVRVRKNNDGSPNFLGEYTHGTSTGRFLYLDIGLAAGQKDSVWSRRLKIPLRGITWEIIAEALADSALVFETRVAGSAKDNSPTCGTVKPFGGWKLGKEKLQKLG